MNKQDFKLNNGYPMNQASLDRMQEAYSVFNALGAIIGDKSIVSGCVVSGGNVADGVVFVNGEVFEFKGGLSQTKVIVKEVTTDLVYKNNNSYPAVKTRYVTFGTGVGAMDWAEFKRPIETKTIPTNLNDRLTVIEKKLAIFQPGGVVFPWFKPAVDIPAGFQEAVDVRGRTIIGYDPMQTEFNTIGKVGGLKNKTLTKAEIPNFSIHLKGSNADNGDPGNLFVTSGAQENVGIDVDVNTGGGAEFSLLNPYKIAMYIEYIG